MSNGKTSGLKRAVDAAFGGDEEPKSKASKQKRSKHSRSQHETVQETRPASTKKDDLISKTERPKAQQLSVSKQKKKQRDTTSKAPKAQQSRGKEAQDRSQRRPRKGQRSHRPDWSISAVEGGQYADHDPLLVQGDRYLILAVRTQILVYSTETSNLVRSLRLEEHETITSYTTSAANKNHLFVSTYSGLLSKWDWTTGQLIKQWKSSDKLIFITEHFQDQKDAASSTLLLIHEALEQNRSVSLVTFLDSSDASNGEVILEEKSLAPWTKVLDYGKHLILYAGSNIYLGQANRRLDQAPPEYIWRKISVPNDIVCIDARSHSMASGTNKKRVAIDIVVGCRNGAMLIYDDILVRLTNKEKNPREGDVVSRRFHWHRKEVLTVKWSLDGNYIISGGHETVMVIWQLDTGQQQFLPHLSAAIQHIAVSKTGSAYSVHLADNSVMVLSTSELQPVAYVSGLILRQRRPNERKGKRIPAVLHPTDAALVALAAPADYSDKVNVSTKATLLQTYNARTQRQSQRQALVRNNITTLNVDPSGRPIQEPDVTHLRISHDGRWLATVDEWAPPEHDTKSLYPEDCDLLSQGREVFLKFWAKNELSQSWELVTKIQNPHSTQREYSCAVLDLEANTQRSEFSTVSSNGSINIWTPKVRHRDGLPVKDKSGSRLYTWTCTWTVEIPIPCRKSGPILNALAYSTDGSVLAASSNKSACVNFIDPLTGNIQHTQHGSYPGVFSHLTFLNHHLVTVSKDLRVYNTVSGDLLYALALHSSVSGVHLAANQSSDTFAVVCLLPAFMSRDTEDTARAKSQVMVFNLKSATPIFRQMVDGTVEILLPLATENGYMIINDIAEVCYLIEKGSIVRKVPEVPPPEDTMRTITALDDILGQKRIAESGHDERAAADMDQGGRGQIMHSYKTQSSLSDIFNNHSTNLPVGALFEQVVSVLQGGAVVPNSR